MRNCNRFVIGLLLIIFFFCFGSSVEALDVNIYNGNSTVTPNAGGSCNNLFKKNIYLCRFKLINNGSENQNRGIRMTFVYASKDASGNWHYEQMGRSLDIWTDHPYGTKNLKSASIFSNSKVNQGSLTLGDFSTGYGYWLAKNLKLNSAWLSKTFLNKDLLNSYVHVLIPGCDLDDHSEKCFGRPTMKASSSGNIDSYGYRLFIEPIRGYATKKDGFFVMTPTEFSRFVISNPSKKFYANYYLSNEDVLYTSFDDVGIHKVTSCVTTKNCYAPDGADIRYGHALQIIDFYDLIKPTCEWKPETGEGQGLPVTEADTKNEEKMDCCEEIVDKIVADTTGIDPGSGSAKMCMDLSSDTASFVTCLATEVQNRFTGDSSVNTELQEKLNQFYEKFPYCKTDCDAYIEKDIEKAYADCQARLPFYQKQISLMAGKTCVATTCEIQFVEHVKRLNQDHPECVYANPFAECPFSKDTEDKDDDSINCDDDNPNHFPASPGQDFNRECCYYYEERLKVQASEYMKNHPDYVYNPDVFDRYDYWDWYYNSMEYYCRSYYNYGKPECLAYEWLEENGKEFRKNCLKSKCDINDDTLTQDCCDEFMNSSIYASKPQSFWVSKGCAVKDKCSIEEYQVNGLDQLTGNCADDIDFEAHDSENWECIFDSDNIKDGSDVSKFKDYYLQYSNPYCSVYCREDIRYNFPDGSVSVLAGSHFTVGTNVSNVPSWSPVKFASDRTCRTSGTTNDNTQKDINYEKFEQEWEVQNDKVVYAWDDYQVADLTRYSYGASTGSGVLDCDERCVRWETGESCSTNSDTGGTSCHTYSYCVETKFFGMTMYPKEVSYARYGESEQDITPGSWCSTDGWDVDVETPRKQFNLEKTELAKMENDISACTDWSYFDANNLLTSISHTDVKALRYFKYDTYDEFKNYYEFAPNLSIRYEEPTNGEYNYEDLLDKSSSVSIQNAKFSSDRCGTKDSSTNCIVKKENKYLCDVKWQACKKVEVFSYGANDEVSYVYHKDLEYHLQPNVFDTVLKPQGSAIHSTNKADIEGQVYMDLGYSALHVHFMTPSGSYPIELYYNKLSPDPELESKKVHNFDQFLNGDTETYTCTYKVENIIVENDDPNCVDDNCTACTTEACDPEGLKGINLLYRTISLGDPFPGVNGNSRLPGSNWKDNVEKYITNNRGVQESKIYYNKSPMYQITLTPAIIQEIRKYNQATTYGDYTLDCIGDTGKECKSRFIRGGLDYMDYDFSKLFLNCTDASGKTEKCCGILNWGDCDTLDDIRRDS